MVASTLDLEEVLDGVVRLLSDASAVHACFVYLLDPKQKRLVLRAASAPYAHLTGGIVLEKGEGLAWWVLTKRRAAFIREGALDEPCLDEAPELARDGARRRPGPPRQLVRAELAAVGERIEDRDGAAERGHPLQRRLTRSGHGRSVPQNRMPLRIAQ